MSKKNILINIQVKYLNKYTGVWKSSPWGSGDASMLLIKYINKFLNINFL